MVSAVIERIKHAKVIRTIQFAEDAGPMAHPIRPEKVIEMNNFYTVTVYDKGAEVIRMMHTILGKEGFRKGTDLYFERHDGQAVTCDDFVAAMADANDKDLTQFKHWYSQAGTPIVEVNESYKAGQLQLTLTQSIPTQAPNEVNTLVIPVKYEILQSDTGHSIEQGVLLFDQQTQTFSFEVSENALLVLFEDFSAPVKVARQQSFEQLCTIVKFASDPFARWDAMQTLWLQTIQNTEYAEPLIALLRSLIEDKTLSEDIKAELIAIPSFDAIAESYLTIDVEEIIDGIEFVVTQAASSLHPLIMDNLSMLQNIENFYSGELVAKRRLKQVFFTYLARQKSNDVSEFISHSFNLANNMTERMLCVDAARINNGNLLTELLQRMDAEFSGNVLVLDKILSSVGQVADNSVYSLMTQWTKHKDFSIKNPNRFRSLYGAFIMRNPSQFHHKSGQGYALLTKLLIELDQINPQVAARMISPLMSFKRFDDERQELMRESLVTLSEQKLSKDLYEKVSSALEN